MNFNPPVNVFMLATYVYWLAIIIVHIALAVAVFRDVEELEQAHGCRPWLLNGGLWALTTLVGGIVTAGIYWAVHHSTLRSSTDVVAAPAANLPQPSTEEKP